MHAAPLHHVLWKYVPVQITNNLDEIFFSDMSCRNSYRHVVETKLKVGLPTVVAAAVEFLSSFLRALGATVASFLRSRGCGVGSLSEPVLLEEVSCNWCSICHSGLVCSRMACKMVFFLYTNVRICYSNNSTCTRVFSYVK